MPLRVRIGLSSPLASRTQIDRGVNEWRQIARRMRDPTRRHHASIFAGGVAFYAFLSTFPALAALVSIYGLLADPEHVRRQVDAVAGTLSPDIRALLHDQIGRLTERSTGTLSIEAAGGIVVATWAATKGMRALLTGLSLSFGQDESRGFLRLNITAFSFTLGAILCGAIAVGGLVVLPMALSFVGLPPVTEQLIRWARWPALTLVTLLGLAVVYHFGPARPPGRWHWITVGSAAATALWLGGSGLFSWLGARLGKGDLIDGSLAVVITMLTWFLLSAYVVVLGAELNAEVQRTRGADTSPDVR
ncbi:MAG TPA: YihY/virulence factor BrkB family protein [Acidobacteriaceae bacterium]|nr:YihY/virulence factor BrkB family protein [Acidobacteriaceae bacterium]